MEEEASKNNPREMLTDLTFAYLMDHYGSIPSRRHSISQTFFHSEKFSDGNFEDSIMVNNSLFPFLKIQLKYL